MQTLKTTKTKEERSLVAMEEKKPQLPAKLVGFLTENKKRAILVLCSILLIGGAILVNWKLFDGEAGQDQYVVEGADSTYVSQTKENKGGDQAGQEGTDTSAKAGETEDTGSFFAMAVIDRQKARDEEMETLQLVVDSKDADDSEKNTALGKIADIAGAIEKEANIESLVKLKGFSECVAVIHDDHASVIVDTDAKLMVSEIAQITQIVYDQTGIPPTNLNIVEK